MTATRVTQDIRTGQAAFASIATNSYKDVAVTFDSPMSSTPKVCAMRRNAGAMGYEIQLATLSTSRNGFTLRCWNFGSAAVTPSADWIAVAT